LGIKKLHDAFVELTVQMLLLIKRMGLEIIKIKTTFELKRLKKSWLS